jgi:hypothetical protein
MNLHDAHFPGNRKIIDVSKIAKYRMEGRVRGSGSYCEPSRAILDTAQCPRMGNCLASGVMIQAGPFGTKEPTIVFDCHDGEITVENRYRTIHSRGRVKARDRFPPFYGSSTGGPGRCLLLQSGTWESSGAQGRSAVNLITINLRKFA